MCYNINLLSFRDKDDDVRTVAAESLAPLAEHLVTRIPEQLSTLLHILWDTLRDVDDLNSSTAAAMKLLGTFFS